MENIMGIAGAMVTNSRIPTWQEYADSRILNDEEKFFTKILQIVLYNKEVRISEFKNNLLSFYIELENVDGLQIKEVTLEQFIENSCKLWANITMFKPFINWKESPMEIFKRIEKLSSYSTFGEVFDEMKLYGKDNIKDIWGVRYDDAIIYLMRRQSEKVQEELAS